MLTPTHPNWRTFFIQSITFFFTALIILTGLRVGFFEAFRSDNILWEDALPAFWMGVRVDAKWLSIALLPAWIFTVLAYIWPAAKKIAISTALLGYGLAVTLGLVNFGFYAFYGTPINAIIFGFIEDDTVAIIKTLVTDWPVSTYLSVWTILLALPFALTRCVKPKSQKHTSFAYFCITIIITTLLLALAIRGSVGKFPLRQQNYAVSNNAFINNIVPGGLALFYEAYKGRKALVLKGGADAGVKELGFQSVEEAQTLLQGLRSTPSTTQAMKSQPHVVFAIMESMGRDAFEAHNSTTNNTLGHLANVLPKGVVFTHAISVANGTFPSLEGLLFDTPLTPITQSQYGHQTFKFSEVLAFKKAGYKTILLTAGQETWRQMSNNFPLQGFDEIIGSGKIHEVFPQAELGTWGIGDEWMFKKAEALLADADRRHEKLLLVMLSITNHSPHRVPDGVQTLPVSVKALPPYIQDKDEQLQQERLTTYQYSANALGHFVERVQTNDIGKRTIIVASGDHNMRFQYQPTDYWHHAHGIPIIFWLPDSLKALGTKANTQRWVTHRDIFPTLRGLALGDTPSLHKGRNLFSEDTWDLAITFEGLGKYGFGIGQWGAVALDGGQQFRCYRWQEDRLLPATCSETMTKMGNATRAQRALADFTVRDGLL